MTCPLIMMLRYSMKIFAVRTFANCPETAKIAKVFTCERFLLYGTITLFINSLHTASRTRLNIHVYYMYRDVVFMELPNSDTPSIGGVIMMIILFTGHTHNCLH